MESLKFNHYRSGVYEGQFEFGTKQLNWLAVDPVSRVQLKTIPFKKEMKESLFDFVKLHAEFETYTGADWSGEKVELEDGARFNRYLTFPGVVNGKEVTGQL